MAEVEDTFMAMYEGVVVDRKDPERRGRVKVKVPGITPDVGLWAPPIGTVGGGDKNRGFFFVPEVGSEVIVFFKMGDEDHPRYLAGVWGAPNGVSDIPLSAQQDANTGEKIPDEEVPNVQVIDTKSYEIVIDNREGHEKLLIREKTSPSRGVTDDEFGPGGDYIELDGTAHGITIRSSRGIVLKSDGAITLDAMSIMFNGRLVAATSKDIT